MSARVQDQEKVRGIFGEDGSLGSVDLIALKVTVSSLKTSP
jgi:hypothetical protein